MRIPFVKMHGCGNDFVMIEDLQSNLELTPEQVAHICDRHFGVGADGVILIRPAEDSDAIAFMHYINSDGTLAQMCGNGVRCFAKYLVDNKLVLPEEKVFNVATRAGIRTITVERGADGLMKYATVDMGKPSFDPKSLPTTLVPTRHDEEWGDIIADFPIDTPRGDLSFTCVSMGNPHAVAFLNDSPSIYVQSVGPAIESSTHFPEKTNVEFARVIGTTEGRRIQMRVYERGCGETLACGTGCCATAVAAYVTGRAPREVDVDILGGTLHIEWKDDGHVFMTGPAATSFEGFIDIGDQA